MKKAYSIRIEESDYRRVTELGKSFPKGLQMLLDNFFSYGEVRNNMEYSEMVEVFKGMKDLLIKYKPAPPTGDPWGISIPEGLIMKSKKERLQEVADKVSNNAITTKSDYHSLYNSLTPTRKQQLTEIINATKKGNYREDSVEYTKNELLEKRGFSQFIGLV